MNWWQLAESIFLSIVKASWHASLLVAIVLCIQFLFRSGISPAWRHVLWMRNEREMACDALVLSRCGEQESGEYDRTLIEVMRHFSRPARMPGLIGIVEDYEHIKKRIVGIY